MPKSLDTEALKRLGVRARPPVSVHSHSIASFFHSVGLLPEFEKKKFFVIRIGIALSLCVLVFWVLKPRELSLPSSVVVAGSQPGHIPFSLPSQNTLSEPARVVDQQFIEDIPDGENTLSSPNVTKIENLEPQIGLHIHVAGAVNNPGMYVFSEGDRVQDAVVAAGGFDDKADKSRVNLAAPLQDGSRLYLLAQGEQSVPEIPADSMGSSQMNNNEQRSTTSTSSTVVSLNNATQAELESLPGVGPATAQAIIEDRIRNGPFLTVQDLDRVSGIGTTKLDRLLPYITI